MAVSARESFWMLRVGGYAAGGFWEGRSVEWRVGVQVLRRLQ